MTAGKRISRRTFWVQLQASSFIRWGDIEGQSKKRHRNRIEIMPNTLPNTSTHCASLCSTVWRLSSMRMGGWLCIDMSLSYVLKTWTLCTFLSQYIDDNNGWKLFFNSRGITLVILSFFSLWRFFFSVFRCFSFYHLLLLFYDARPKSRVVRLFVPL